MDGIYYFLLGVFVASLLFLIIMAKEDEKKRIDYIKNIPNQPSVPKMPKAVNTSKKKKKKKRRKK